ncbi:hypothetical protein LCGC14_2834440 [marine sediment metagenome]|uniref:Uncharacterized protein n=1 Tax=marine sediment metagenome TaxID=412755 RepID=A0A0F9B440_9ZZZZ
MARYGPSGKESRNATNQRQYWRLKREVIEHYSESMDGIIRPRCGACGELDIDALMLTADKSLKKLHGYGRQLYDNLKRAGYPDGFKVLCFNCDHKGRL